MKFSFSKLLVSILISLGTGVLSGLLSRGGMEVYQRVNKPAFSPPPILFPIVWTILFILMGISAYMIYNVATIRKQKTVSKSSEKTCEVYCFTCVV